MSEVEFYKKIGAFLGKVVADFHGRKQLLLRLEKPRIADRDYRMKHPYCCVIDVQIPPECSFDRDDVTTHACT